MKYFDLQEINTKRTVLDEVFGDEVRIIWSTTAKNQISIDDEPVTMGKDRILFLTEKHRLKFHEVSNLRIWRFNSEFVNVNEEDDYLGGVGMLYYGANEPMQLRIGKKDMELLQMIWTLADAEFETNQYYSLDVVAALTYRLIIMCRNMYRNQFCKPRLTDKQHELLRTYSMHVENNYVDKHSVRDYEKLLDRSPKTINHLFLQFDKGSPIKFIHKRITRETKRLLRYTDMDIASISEAMGFKRSNAFSRFFKDLEGLSPNKFRNKVREEMED